MPEGCGRKEKKGGGSVVLLLLDVGSGSTLLAVRGRHELFLNPGRY